MLSFHAATVGSLTSLDELESLWMMFTVIWTLVKGTTVGFALSQKSECSTNCHPRTGKLADVIKSLRQKIEGYRFSYIS
jgi:hypothetical protein